MFFNFFDKQKLLKKLERALKFHLDEGEIYLSSEPSVVIALFIIKHLKTSAVRNFIIQRDLSLHHHTSALA